MSKEFRIGLIALVAGVLFYYGFNYLKGTDILTNQDRYYVSYENTDGLTLGSMVKMQGVPIGKVSDISYDQKIRTIEVEVSIQSDIVLGDSTVAELASDGLLGGKAIILNDYTTNGALEPGSTLIAKVDPGLSEFIAAGGQITDNLTVTIRRINEILLGMEGSGEEIKRTITDLSKLIRDTDKVVSGNEESLAITMRNVASMTTSLDKQMKKLNPIMNNMLAFSDSLSSSDIKATIASTNALLRNINNTLDSVKSEQGTLGKLMSDDSLYNSLNQTMVHLDSLIIHFNNHPKDFLGPLGRKNKRLDGPQIK